jgi:hypothetical protein
LKTIDRISAAKDQKALDALYDTYAPIDPTRTPWVKAIAPRTKGLPEEPALLTQPFHFADDGTLVLDGDPAKLEEMAGLMMR